MQVSSPEQGLSVFKFSLKMNSSIETAQNCPPASKHKQRQQQQGKNQSWPTKNLRKTPLNHRPPPLCLLCQLPCPLHPEPEPARGNSQSSDPEPFKILLVPAWADEQNSCAEGNRAERIVLAWNTAMRLQHNPHLMGKILVFTPRSFSREIQVFVSSLVIQTQHSFLEDGEWFIQILNRVWKTDLLKEKTGRENQNKMGTPMYRCILTPNLT